MLEILDIPNLLAGALIGCVLFWFAKQHWDRKHREIVHRLVELEKQGVLKLDKDGHGNILRIEPAKLEVQAHPPTIRTDERSED